jgi:hypothetical protein
MEALGHDGQAPPAIRRNLDVTAPVNETKHICHR